MITFKEAEDLIEQSYCEFRELTTPILIMIKLGNINIPLKINDAPWRHGEITSPRISEIIKDCETLTQLFTLDENVLQLEKKYFDKFFERFQTIQKSWKIMDLLNYHVMPFWALITGDLFSYRCVINHLIYEYWENYPIKWYTYIMSGQQIEDRDKEWDARGVKYLDDERRINSGSNDYKVNVDKWYILRRYYRAIPDREEKDLGYTEIVSETDIPSKSKALKALEQDEREDFEPLYKCEYGTIMGSVEFQLWGKEN